MQSKNEWAEGGIDKY